MTTICRVIEAGFLPSLTKPNHLNALKIIEKSLIVNRLDILYTKGGNISKFFTCKYEYLCKKNPTSTCNIVSNCLSINKRICLNNMSSEGRSNSRDLKRKKTKHLGWLLAGCCFSKKKKSDTNVDETAPLISDLQTTELPVENDDGQIPFISAESPVFLLEKPHPPNVTLKDLDHLVDSHPGVSGEASAKVESPVCLLEKPHLQNFTLKTLDNLVDSHPGVSGEASSCSKGQVVKKSSKSDRPTHFVAIQVNCPKIHKALELIQDCILQRKPTMKSALNSLPTLHITLIVMNISNEEDLQRSKEALTELYHKVRADFLKNPLVLEFQGISNFRKKVLYADLRKGESYDRLQCLYENIVTTYEAYGFDVRERGSWTPHLTIAKLSKQDHRRPIKSIDPRWYEDHQTSVFGCQPVNSLQLLSMTERKNAQGYYQCKQECFFAVPSAEMEINSQKKVEMREKIRQLTSDVLRNMEK